MFKRSTLLVASIFFATHVAAEPSEEIKTPAGSAIEKAYTELRSAANPISRLTRRIKASSIQNGPLMSWHHSVCMVSEEIGRHDSIRYRMEQFCQNKGGEVIESAVRGWQQCEVERSGDKFVWYAFAARRDGVCSPSGLTEFLLHVHEAPQDSLTDPEVQEKWRAMRVSTSTELASLRETERREEAARQLARVERERDQLARKGVRVCQPVSRTRFLQGFVEDVEGGRIKVLVVGHSYSKESAVVDEDRFQQRHTWANMVEWELCGLE